MNTHTKKNLVLAIVLGAVVALFPFTGDTAVPYTAPSGDLNDNGSVDVQDIQCEILLYTQLFLAGIPDVDLCQTDADCVAEFGEGMYCRAGFTEFKVCVPACLSTTVTIGTGDVAICTDPDADDGDCLGLVPKRVADLNCDGSITNVDFQFLVAVIMGKTGGPDTADFDGDGKLNFCDDDYDGDGDPDETDCGIMDPSLHAAATELCDGADNDCDGFVDADDPDVASCGCTTEADCPSSLTTPAVCDAPATCQGTRTEALCDEATCIADVIEDDSACDVSVIADDCGAFPDLVCTGDEVQAIPACAETCAGDEECDAAGHCDAPICLPDVAAGEPCDEDSDCVDGLQCDGVCKVVGDDCTLDTDCNDQNPCTDETCDPTYGCQYVDNFLPCSDGSACTEGDTCGAGGECLGGPAPDCDDDNPCTDDWCDALEGCVTAPNALDCDDGDVCTEGDVCSDGNCVSGVQVSCDDLNVCTEDACDPVDGCSWTAVANPCSDMDACTTDDECVGGECVGGPQLDCDDANSCTEEWCDLLVGCIFVPVEADCTDGTVCTEGDHCVEGECQSTGSLDCDDGNPCTDDTCDPADGCQTSPNTDSCDDSDVCTPTDTCVDGSCLGTGSIDCDDDVDCTVDGCDASLGCQHTADHDFCDDGDHCNGIEVCDLLDDCVVGSLPPETDTTCDEVDDDCDGEVDEDAFPPCFAKEVTDADLHFLATVGLPTGIVTDNGDGTYDTQVVDLSNPNLLGALSAEANDNSTAPVSFATQAGVPAAVELVASRAVLCADDPQLRAFAYVTDAIGSPVAPGTSVQFTLDLDGETVIEPGVSLGDGLFSAWLIAPAGLFINGADGVVAASTGDVDSPPVDVTAAALPTAMALDPGSAGVTLPLCPRFDGTSFDVPVTVNTGANVLGSYNITLLFDETVLQVTGVSQGSATDLATPVSNAATTANTLGSLSFNAVNTNPGGGTATGPEVEIAVVHFEMIADLPAGMTAEISGEVLELANTVGAGISFLDDPVLQVWDGQGQSDAGLIEVKNAEVEGIFARMDDNTLLDLSALDGSVASTGVAVLGVFGDGTWTDIRDDGGTVCQSGDEAVVTTAACEVFAAGPGTTLVAAQAGGFEASANVWTLTPELPLAVSALDATLSTITDFGVVQGTRPKVQATLSDGVFLSFTIDVTDKVSYTSSNPVVLFVEPNTGTAVAMSNGAAQLRAMGPGDTVLGETGIVVDDTSAVTATGIHVVIPAYMSITGVNPESVPDDEASASVQARVLAFFAAEGGSVQSTALLVLSDDEETGGGSRIDVTGGEDTSFSSSDDAVGTVDENGMVTATGGGAAQVDVSLEDGQGQEIASGSGEFDVQLPAPTEVVAVVSDPRVALTDTDGSAELLGLPTDRQITVTVYFENGTSMDFTGDPRTNYDAVSQDPEDLVSVTNLSDCDGIPDCTPGLVASKGTDHGKASVVITFPDTYLDIVSTSIEIEVVTHEGINLESWELFTPAGTEQAPEHLLSYIEGTGVWQRSQLEVVESFTDGSMVDITTNPGTTISVYDPGTETPQGGVIAVDAGALVTAIAVGTVDVVAERDGNATQPLTLGVDGALADLVQCDLSYTGGSTFKGIKDLGTAQLDVWCAYGDGTRNRLTGSELIPGLLHFESDAPEFATVEPDGVATARGNGPVTFAVDVDVAVDTENPYDPPTPLILNVNLLPAAGDVDLGNPSGLAFPDRDMDEVFEMPVRVNTGGSVLGGIDLELSYDPAVIEIVDAVAGSGIPGALFSTNHSQAGIVFLNASPPVTGPPVSGSAVEIAVLTFKALKSDGGPQVTDIGGTVVGVIDADSATIGAPTPRPIVAGDGLLDPPPGGVWGDANDDEAFSIADILFIQQISVDPPLVLPDATQLEQSDIFPDGELLLTDAFFGSQALARLTHFLDVEAVEDPTHPGEYDLIALVIDRDQEPVTDFCRVRFEVSSSVNLGTLEFTGPHEGTASGLITTAWHAGGGTYTTRVSGVLTPEAMGLVVIVDVLDGQGEVVNSTAYIESPVLDPQASFVPTLTFGEWTPCFPADPNCDVCSEPGVCLYCVDGWFLLDGACVSDCAAQGAYFNGDGVCGACGANCDVCTDAEICTDCAGDYTLYDGVCLECEPACDLCSDSETCTDCSVGYFLVTGDCIACEPNCDSCSDAETCTECTDDWYLLDANCVADCPTEGAYFNDGAVCTECGANCDSCPDAGLCTDCAIDWYLLNEACVSDCAAQGGYFNDGGVCTGCEVNCDVCSDEITCSDCAESWYLLNADCVSDCAAQGAYFNDGGACTACEENCTSCDDAATCTACTMGYYALAGDCAPCADNCVACSGATTCTECVAGYFLADGLCAICESNCGVCSDGTTCTDCVDGWYLLNFDCVADCPAQGPYFNDGGACTACETNCDACTDGVVCSDCSVDWYLHESDCVADCAAQGAYFNDAEVCTACAVGCAACDDGTTCTDCIAGYTLVGADCVDCESNCAVCSDVTTCTDCAESWFLLDADCVADCADEGAYFNDDGVCTECEDDCDACTDAETCTDCSDGWYLLDEDCFTGCAAQGAYFNDGGVCTACEINCNACSDAATCTTCLDGWFLLNADCVSDCAAQGAYFNDGGQCSACEDNCSACSDGETCTACAESWYLLDSSCVDDCPSQGAYFNDGGQCTACEDNCDACSDALTCTDCAVGYFLASEDCSPCEEGCDVCTDTVTCVDCTEDWYLLDSDCVPDCAAEGAYFNDVEVCTACEPDCDACSDAVTCTNCSGALYVLLGDCVEDCPTEGPYFNDGDVCTACEDGCAECTDAEICTSCLVSYFMYEQDCIACEDGCDECSDTETCITCTLGYEFDVGDCNQGLLVFLTSEKYTGDLGGIAGADAKCQTLADNAGLPGTYVAWLSDALQSPSTSFLPWDGPYIVRDGSRVAAGWTGLTTETLDHAINRTEFGDYLGPDVLDQAVWTNSFPSGEMFTNATTSTCNNWQSGSQADHAFIGIPIKSNPQWSAYWVATFCNSPSHMYCFQQVPGCYEAAPEDPPHGDYPDCWPMANDGICALTCELGYYATGDAQAECLDGAWISVETCEACGSECETCIDSNTCTDCASGYFVDTGACVACEPNCTECTSAETCTECPVGYTVSAGDCIQNCEFEPPAPADGSYAGCIDTAHGGFCALICDAGYVATNDGVAECDAGSWINGESCVEGPSKAGMIAFTAVNTDFPYDAFTFVALVDIVSSMPIQFTDDGWTSAGDWYGDSAEVHATWTATDLIPAGTQVTLTVESSGEVSASHGSLSVPGGGMSLINGDQILAYLGSKTSPQFVAGIHLDYSSSNYDWDTAWNAEGSGTCCSVRPEGLDEVTSVALFPWPGPERDNVRYNCTALSTGTRAELAAALNDPDNWASDDFYPFDQPAPCTFTVTD